MDNPEGFNYLAQPLHHHYSDSFDRSVLLCSSPDNQLMGNYYQPSSLDMFNACHSPLFQPVHSILPTQHDHLSEQYISRYPDVYSYPTPLSDYRESPQLGTVRPSSALLQSVEQTSLSRSTSFTSNASSSWMSCRRGELSRSTSPNASEMSKYGSLREDGTWGCAFPGCTSKSLFRRGCDLRKHYRRHTKSLFCRHAGCRQATEGGFSSEKDRARHEAKHDPKILCEWDGCSRVFSRVDNMRDHVRRIHRRKIMRS